MPPFLQPKKRVNRTMLNPFGDTGRITDPDRFFDRETLLTAIFDTLQQQQNVSLVGAPGMGKSSLLAMICALGPQILGVPPDTFVYFNLHYITTEEIFYDVVCKELRVETTRGSLFTRMLQHREHILCIDGLEAVRHRQSVLQHIGALCDIALADDSPLTVVMAAQQSPTTILHHIAQSHKPAQCRTFGVEPFSRETSDAFVQHRLQTTQTVFGENELALIFEQSGGIPLLVQQIAADLYRGFSLLKKEP